MDSVIIEKGGLRYSVERFNTDGQKQIVDRGGIAVNVPYKAGQFVVTSLGLHPGNRATCEVTDRLTDSDFTVVEGTFDVFSPDSKPAKLQLSDQEGGVEGNQTLAKDLLGLGPEAKQPPVDNDHVAPGAEQFTEEVIAENLIVE